MGGVAPRNQASGNMDCFGTTKQHQQPSGESLLLVEIGRTQPPQSCPPRRLALGMVPGEHEVEVVDTPWPAAGRQHLTAPGKDWLHFANVGRLLFIGERQAPLAKVQPFATLPNRRQPRTKLSSPSRRPPSFEKLHRALPYAGLLHSLLYRDTCRPA
jgi:hypothetical protein